MAALNLSRWREGSGPWLVGGILVLLGFFGWIVSVQSHEHALATSPVEAPTPNPQILPEGVKTWFKRDALVYRAADPEMGVLRRVKAGDLFVYGSMVRSWVKERGGEGWAQLSDLTGEKPLTKKELAHKALQEMRRDRAEKDALAPVRRQYGKELRELFLDKGFDVTVTVSGKAADRIALKYVLANAVWAHRLDKDGVLSKLHEMGFQRVDLEDGYDYHRYWTWR